MSGQKNLRTASIWVLVNMYPGMTFKEIYEARNWKKSDRQFRREIDQMVEDGMLQRHPDDEKASSPRYIVKVESFQQALEAIVCHR